MYRGDYKCLQAGSTTFELAALLEDRFHELTVFTHSIEVARILSERENIHVILADSSKFENCAPLKICENVHVIRG